MTDDMTRNDLLYVMKEGWLDTWRFDHQPTTNDIRTHTVTDDRYVIQLIGAQFHVYDLSTLRWHYSNATIGVPEFVTDSHDAAVAFALLKVSSEP